MVAPAGASASAPSASNRRHRRRRQWWTMLRRRRRARWFRCLQQLRRSGSQNGSTSRSQRLGQSTRPAFGGAAPALGARAVAPPASVMLRHGRSGLERARVSTQDACAVSRRAVPVPWCSVATRERAARACCCVVEGLRREQTRADLLSLAGDVLSSIARGIDQRHPRGGGSAARAFFLFCPGSFFGAARRAHGARV